MSGVSRHPAAVTTVRQMAMVAVPIVVDVLLPPVGGSALDSSRSE
jgi:hypothetical protein